MTRRQEIPQELKDLISTIESKDLHLLDVKLPALSEYSSYDQFLRVQDVNIVLSQNHFKITPSRILIHKTNKTELKLNLLIPEFIKSFDSLSNFKKEDGSDFLAETIYEEYVQEEATDENPAPQPFLEIKETKQEPVQIKSLSYILYFFQSENFIKTIENFTKEFIQEEIIKNPNAFKTLQ